MCCKFFYPLFVALFILTTGMAYKTRDVPLTQPLSVGIEDYREQLPENIEILTSFDQFNGELQKVYLEGKGLTKSDYQKILESVVFLATTGEGRAAHSIKAASHLLTVGKMVQKELLMACLLQHTLENRSIEEISTLFGMPVAYLIQEVTDDPSLPSHVQKEQQVLKAHQKSAGAAMIQLADLYVYLSDLKKVSDSTGIDQSFRQAKAVIDNLPWVHATLKQSVEAVITTYWKSRAI